MNYYATDLDVEPFSRLFRALGDPHRMRIFAYLSCRDLCVGHLQELLQISQPSVSNHLAVLRNARMVSSVRKRSWVFYRLAELGDASSDRMLKALQKHFLGDPRLTEDVDTVLAKSEAPQRPPKSEK
jgi:DNA-binding transcriptional ArsR family regulator